MMYFSRLKTALVLGICVLGVLLCLPNLFPAPAPWLPWRTITSAWTCAAAATC